MALSNVKTNVVSDSLSRPLTLNDGVSAIISSATSVTSKMVLGQVYTVTSLKDAERKLEINTTGANAHLHSAISDYYLTLGGSTLLYLLPVASSVTMTEMLNSNNECIANLQAKGKGEDKTIGSNKRERWHGDY